MPAIDIPSDRKKQVAKYRVKYKDIFDLKKFYEDLHEWLKEHGWKDLEDDWDHFETFYLEKIDMAGFKEIWIKWRPYKIPAPNAYYRYWLDFDYHCTGLKSTEVVKEGKKLKADKGEVELFITAVMELDIDGKWSKHPFLKYFQKIFPERIFRRDIEDHQKELYREAYELQSFIKQWFKMKRYLPYEETTSFFPSYAWPSHLKE